MTEEFRNALVKHCGPVLLGQKPAALLPLSRKAGREALYISKTVDKGMASELLFRREQSDLMLIYRARLLKEALEDKSVQESLAALGYPANADAERMLAHLKRRFESAGEFPHEVGFFLGYPPEDVLGFMEHRGQGCKFCGKWKVYGDVSQAKRLFEQYDRCRELLASYLSSGGSLYGLCLDVAG